MSNVTLGYPVVFQVPEIHLTKTMRSGAELSGSIYHAEQSEFAGSVGRTHEDGTVDIALLIPGHPDVRWVVNVQEGDGPGKFRPISG